MTNIGLSPVPARPRPNKRFPNYFNHFFDCHRGAGGPEINSMDLTQFTCTICHVTGSGSFTRWKFDTICIKADTESDPVYLQWTWIAANNWGSCHNGGRGMGCGPQVIVMTWWHQLSHRRHNKSPMKLDNIFDRNRKQRFPWEQIWQSVTPTRLTRTDRQGWQKVDRLSLISRSDSISGSGSVSHRLQDDSITGYLLYFNLNSFCIFYSKFSWRIWCMFEHFLLGNIQVLCGRLYIEQKPSQVENWIRKDGNSEKIIFYYEKKRKGICYN